MIATGEQHSVREFVEAAFHEVGISVRWEGTGVNEIGRNALTGDVLVVVDPRYFRPTQVEMLLGDPSKAIEILGWRPRIGFKELVAEMVREDIKEVERDLLCRKEGYRTYSFHELKPKTVFSQRRSAREENREIPKVKHYFFSY